jgi:NTP pyrophosphatase (non-canonical NTP hydrolase)
MIDSQRDVERFTLRHDLQYDAVTHMLDLVSEVGELAKLVLQASDYGRRPLDDAVDFSGELGDAFYSLLTLAVVLDVDTGEALDRALQKYERRLQERGGPGSV